MTALFGSDANPYSTFCLDMDKRLDLGPGRRRAPPPHTGAHRLSTGRPHNPAIVVRYSTAASCQEALLSKQTDHAGG
ncbi:hypothetical protein ACFXKS_07460 [Streptomyces scopuliridis]|uniref:hypothetical protein n=1 Tax=Streptomyces scopuliridis TaxID=452529 RepID=UPI0036BAD69D